MFDGVEVVLGPRCGDSYPVIKGLEAGQRVAVAGAFLLDAETRLNPSLASSYFGAGGRAQSSSPSSSVAVAGSPDDRSPLAKLEPGDRILAERQKICPVTRKALGSMGTPARVVVAGRVVFLCCAGARTRSRPTPQGTLPNFPPNHAHDRRDHHLLDPPSRPGDRRQRGAGRAGCLGPVDHARRCHSRPFRESGHRLHRLEGARPPRDRRPGDLSPGSGPPGGQRRARGPLVQRRRVLDDQRDLRGPRGVRRSEEARGGAAGPRSGPASRRAPWLRWRPTRSPPARSSGTRSKGPGWTWDASAPSRTGTCVPSSARWRAWPRSRAWGAIPTSTRSPWTLGGSRRWSCRSRRSSTRWPRPTRRPEAMSSPRARPSTSCAEWAGSGPRAGLATPASIRKRALADLERIPLATRSVRHGSPRRDRPRVDRARLSAAGSSRRMATRSPAAWSSCPTARTRSRSPRGSRRRSASFSTAFPGG